MISIHLEGLDDVLASIRSLPSSFDTDMALETVGQQFSSRLRAATPKGYSGRLRDSVLYEVVAESRTVTVGYDQAVETAGNPKLDSVRRVKTKGRSVLREWTKASDLESVLEETFDSYADEAVSVFERSVPSVVS